jgi:uncharacterized protein (TIGR02302 family)
MDERPRNEPRLLLSRALQRAHGSLLWERLWPALAAMATVLGLFLALSWAGLWLVLPPMARTVGVAIFAVLLIVAALPLLRLRVPTRRDALDRVDKASGEPHRPATALTDTMAANGHDPVAQALWQAHRERALLSARRLRSGWPSPRIALRDPMALRALVLLLVAASFIAAGSDRGKRVLAAFDWHGVVPPKNFRVDAWVNPPSYTARPPVMLTGIATDESAVSVPSGSVLVVRATGNVHIDVTTKGGLEPAPAEQNAALPAGSEEHRLIIKTDGSAAVHGVLGSDHVWRFAAIPDKPPTIELTKDPERQARGALRLDYKMEDDYGVVEAKAILALKDSANAGAHPLFGPPDFPLSLPQQRTRSGTAQTTRDLTAHPWAGAEVRVTLTAKDEAGNEGHSAARDFTLPERIFVKPVARALIEQRRNLALDGGAKPIVLTALDALALAPEQFAIEASVYLGLRTIYHQLDIAKSDDELREVVGRLWDMAVQLEDGNVSQAEQALRDAQEALRQALERGASEEEIKKLMDNLRAAMDRFLQALAQEMQRNPQNQSRPLDRNTRMLSQQDLKSMLDRLENLARSGNREAAQQLLDQLQQMMENLQTARPGMQQDGDDDMNSALDELSDMIRKQQQLRDKTFKQGQDQRRQQQQGQRGQRGQQGQQGRPQMGDLRQDQQALKDRLNKLLEQLRKRGLGDQQQGQKGEQGEQGEQGDQMGQQLGDAGDAMGEAESDLGQGDADGAVDSQGRALEAMRKGAQGLAQQMQQQQGQGQGPGQPGRLGRARADQQTDPLGRPLRGRGYDNDPSVRVPGEIDAQRARRILEELRRRFGESTRPQLELDYLERLLQGF